MNGPDAGELARIQYFTDLALAYGDVSNTFLNFNIIITAAALGWAISSRNWKAGLPPVSCAVFAVGYLVFSLVILYCVGILYDRMNAAIRVSAELWAASSFPHDMGAILEQIGAEHWPSRADAGYLFGNFFSEGRLFLFAINVLAAIAGALLLSSLGRKPERE